MKGLKILYVALLSTLFVSTASANNWFWIVISSNWNTCWTWYTAESLRNFSWIDNVEVRKELLKCYKSDNDKPVVSYSPTKANFNQDTTTEITISVNDYSWAWITWDIAYFYNGVLWTSPFTTLGNWTRTAVVDIDLDNDWKPDEWAHNITVLVQDNSGPLWKEWKSGNETNTDNNYTVYVDRTAPEIQSTGQSTNTSWSTSWSTSNVNITAIDKYDSKEVARDNLKVGSITPIANWNLVPVAEYKWCIKWDEGCISDSISYRTVCNLGYSESTSGTCVPNKVSETCSNIADFSGTIFNPNGYYFGGDRIWNIDAVAPSNSLLDSSNPEGLLKPYKDNTVYEYTVADENGAYIATFNKNTKTYEPELGLPCKVICKAGFHYDNANACISDTMAAEISIKPTYKVKVWDSPRSSLWIIRKANKLLSSAKFVWWNLQENLKIFGDYDWEKWKFYSDSNKTEVVAELKDVRPDVNKIIKLDPYGCPLSEWLYVVQCTLQ